MGLAQKHVENMVSHLELEKNSPVWTIKFKDESVFRFSLREGRASPQLHGKAGSMADACLKDLDYIDSTPEICVFLFGDGTKFDIDLTQESMKALKLQWTKHPKIMGDMPLVILTSDELWSAFSLFDPNAYPKTCATLARGCAEKAAQIFFNFGLAQEALTVDSGRMIEVFRGSNAQPSPLTKDLVNEIQVEHDSLRLTTAVNGFFTELKSFLDLYGFLIGKLTGATDKGDFSRAPVDGGNPITGGHIIKALRKSAAVFSNGKTLADVIEQRSREWLTKAVELRDQGVHGIEIGSLRKVRCIATRPLGAAEYDFVILPVAIAETDLMEHLGQLIEKLRDFIVETQSYLPNVKRELLLPNNFGPRSVEEVRERAAQGVEKTTV